MNHELEDVEGLLREQAKRIEALEAALERSITRGSDAVERIATLEAALREAERFVSYLANETDGCFAGSGTPTTCLVVIRAALDRPYYEAAAKAVLALSPAPEGEAVAWQKRPVFGDIRLRVWTPVEADPEVQDFWRMVNYEIRPLYATPQSISTREAVIEECAKLCEGLRHVDYPSETSEWSSGTFDCAQAIRALGTGS